MSSSKNLQDLMKSPLLSGIALIIVGILFCALRGDFVSIILTIVGVVLIILGALALIGKNWTVGAIEVVVGAVIIACGWTVIDITLLILGIALIAYAIYQGILLIPRLKKQKPLDAVLSLLSPLFTLALGVILVVAKWKTVDAIFIVVGVLAVAFGAYMIGRSLMHPNEN